MAECHGARRFYLAVSHGANSICFIFVYHESITFKSRIIQLHRSHAPVRFEFGEPIRAVTQELVGLW